MNNSTSILLDIVKLKTLEVKREALSFWQFGKRRALANEMNELCVRIDAKFEVKNP